MRRLARFSTHPPLEERTRQLQELGRAQHNALAGKKVYVGVENLRRRTARLRLALPQEFHEAERYRIAVREYVKAEWRAKPAAPRSPPLTGKRLPMRDSTDIRRPRRLSPPWIVSFHHPRHGRS